MSDAANAYYNAWNAVMGTPEKRLLCIWHVGRNWTAQLKKQISSSDKRKDLSQKLETLMSSKNEQDFATMLKHILDHGADPDLADFVQYFKSQYAGNPELWGYCFREGIHLNTNNYLESMHNELKTNYLGGKHNARLDKLLYVLVQLTRDRLMKLVLSKVNPKADCKSSANFKRHREALKIHSAKDVSQLCEGEWVVGAQTHVRDQYTVCLLGECTGCYLSCQYCCACLHKFKCSCLDFRMHNCVCKHIHAVALWQVNQKSLSLDENSDKAIPSTSASNQPLLDPENNDLPVPSLSTKDQLFQDPLSLLNRIESSGTLQAQDCNEIGSIETKMAVAIQGLRALHGSLDSATAKLVHSHMDSILRLVKQAADKGLQPARTPANKRLEKQPTGWAPKKHSSRSASAYGGPATALQRHYILQQAREGGEVPVILTESAHNYSA